MKGLIYKLKVYEGILGYTHGWGEEIEEIYLPEAGISFNKKAVFRTDDKRYGAVDTELLEEITVDENDVQILKNFVDAKDNAFIAARKYLKADEEKKSGKKEKSGCSVLGVEQEKALEEIINNFREK